MCTCTHLHTNTHTHNYSCMVKSDNLRTNSKATAAAVYIQSDSWSCIRHYYILDSCYCAILRLDSINRSINGFECIMWGAH